MDENTWRQFRADYSVKDLRIRFELEKRWREAGRIPKADMRKIIAIYAVKSKATGEKFLVADEKNQEIFREVFDYMYSISYHRSEIIEFVKVERVDESGNVSYVTEAIPRIILTIKRKTKSAYRAAEHFEFKKKQMQYLDTLLSNDFNEMWAALVE